MSFFGLDFGLGGEELCAADFELAKLSIYHNCHRLKTNFACHLCVSFPSRSPAAGIARTCWPAAARRLLSGGRAPPRTSTHPFPDRSSWERWRRTRSSAAVKIDRQPPDACDDVAAAEESGRPPGYLGPPPTPCHKGDVREHLLSSLLFQSDLERRCSEVTISLLQFGWEELCINLLQFLPWEFHVSFLSIK